MATSNINGASVQRFAIPLVAAVMASASMAHAAVYEWSGTCTLGCTGGASGVLTLTDGASPLAFNNSQFVSLQYHSSSGDFFLDNTSPYLAAQGGDWAGSGTFLEQNAFGPNTLPLWQFGSNMVAIPTLTLSPDAGAWQFLSGSYFWTCGNLSCTTWSDDVVRNVGVGSTFSLESTSPVPGPIVGAGLPGLVMAIAGFIGWRRSRRAGSAAKTDVTAASLGALGRPWA